MTKISMSWAMSQLCDRSMTVTCKEVKSSDLDRAALRWALPKAEAAGNVYGNKIHWWHGKAQVWIEFTLTGRSVAAELIGGDFSPHGRSSCPLCNNYETMNTIQRIIKTDAYQCWWLANVDRLVDAVTNAREAVNAFLADHPSFDSVVSRRMGVPFCEWRLACGWTASFALKMRRSGDCVITNSAQSFEPIVIRG